MTNGVDEGAESAARAASSRRAAAARGFLRRNRRARLAGLSLVVACSVLVLPALDATPARAQAQGQTSAQTSVEFVSNAEQSADATSAVGIYRAQAFTTGGNSGGYTLTAVEIEATNTPTEAEGSSLGIYQSNANNKPSIGDLTPVGRLARESGPAGVARFATPGYDLEANTTYFVVLLRRSSTGDASYDLTNADAEDSGAEAGWSIGNGSLWKNSWTGEWSASDASLKMNLHGRSGPVVTTGATVDGSSLTLSFNQALDEDSAPATSAFQVTVTNTSEPGVRWRCRLWCPRTVAVSEVALSGSDAVLTLAEPVLSHWTAVLTYEAPTANSLRGAVLGNALVESFDELSVSVLTANTPPTAESASAAGKGLRILHNEVVTGDSVPGSAFTVTATSEEGTRTIAGTGTVEVLTQADGVYASDVFVTLATAVKHGEQLTASYVKPSANQNVDRDGAAVESYSDLPVANRSIDPSSIRRITTPVTNRRPMAESLAIVSEPLLGDGDTYGLGETIKVQVTFDVDVYVDTGGGVPRLTLDLDPAAWGEAHAVYESGNGTDTLTFVYTVVEPNLSTQGVAVLASSLELNGGRITGTDDAVPPAASLSHAGLGHDPAHKVDWRDQSPSLAVSLVSTATQPTFGRGLGFDYDFAQAFTTGSNSAGYTLTGMRVAFYEHARSRSSAGLSFGIFSDASGSPGSSVGTLTAPATLLGLGRFSTLTAANCGIDLAPNTTYHLVIDSSLVVWGDWLSTASTSEDPGAAPGWSVADHIRFRDHDSTGAWSTTFGSLKLAVQGQRNVGPSPGCATADGAGPSQQSSSVSGSWLMVAFDEALDEGSAPAGSSFEVTVAPAGGADGIGGVGAQATSGVRANSGGSNGGRIAGTGTASVDGALVTVTLAQAPPVGAKLTVSYTPPDASPLRDLEGDEAEEFSGLPVARVVVDPNRAPVVEEQAGNFASFTSQGNAPRGVLVTKPFDGMFSDPDGDELTYTVALSDPSQTALVDVAHVLTAEELALSPRPDVVAGLVWFRADAEADWYGLDPVPPDPVQIAVTLTATDPGGLSASVEGVFVTSWGPRVESVAVVSDAGPDGTYALGDTIRVAVSFEGPVSVDTSGGVPRLAIDMDPAPWGTKWASYVSGSGTATLTFAHTVVEPNYSTEGIAVLADTLELNGGTIGVATATGITHAALAHRGLGHDPDHRVDWRLAPAPATPKVTAVEVVSDPGADATYELGDTIRIAVTLSEAVSVIGAPTLDIDMDPADWGTKQAAYHSGSGTTTLTFTHTVVQPNYSSQGIAVLADTLTLNGGTITTAAGTDADLAHTGLAHDAGHKVDWQR